MSNVSFFPVIPTGLDCGFVIDDPAEFAAAMKYLTRFGDKFNPTRVSGDDTGLTLTMRAQDEGVFTRAVAGQITNPNVPMIAFNGTFAQSIVAGFVEPVTVLTETAEKPAVIVAAHPEGGERLRLLMPVRV